MCDPGRCNLCNTCLIPIFFVLMVFCSFYDLGTFRFCDLLAEVYIKTSIFIDRVLRSLNESRFDFNNISAQDTQDPAELPEWPAHFPKVVKLPKERLRKNTSHTNNSTLNSSVILCCRESPVFRDRHRKPTRWDRIWAVLNTTFIGRIHEYLKKIVPHLAQDSLEYLL